MRKNTTHYYEQDTEKVKEYLTERSRTASEWIYKEIKRHNLEQGISCCGLTRHV